MDSYHTLHSLVFFYSPRWNKVRILILLPDPTPIPGMAVLYQGASSRCSIPQHSAAHPGRAAALLRLKGLWQFSKLDGKILRWLGNGWVPVFICVLPELASRPNISGLWGLKRKEDVWLFMGILFPLSGMPVLQETVSSRAGDICLQLLKEIFSRNLSKL